MTKLRLGNAYPRSSASPRHAGPTLLPARHGLNHGRCRESFHSLDALVSTQLFFALKGQPQISLGHSAAPPRPRTRSEELDLSPERAKQLRVRLCRPFRASNTAPPLTQGGAAWLSPLRSALGWFVVAPSGRRRTSSEDSLSSSHMRTYGGRVRPGPESIWLSPRDVVFLQVVAGGYS